MLNGSVWSYDGVDFIAASTYSFPAFCNSIEYAVYDEDWHLWNVFLYDVPQTPYHSLLHVHVINIYYNMQAVWR